MLQAVADMPVIMFSLAVAANFILDFDYNLIFLLQFDEVFILRSANITLFSQ